MVVHKGPPMVHNPPRALTKDKGLPAAPTRANTGAGEGHGNWLRRSSQERGRPERREPGGAEGSPARQELRQGRRGRGVGRRVVRASGGGPVARGAGRRGAA